MDDADTRVCVTAERALLPLEAGCTAPVGALAQVVEGDEVRSSRCARSSAPRTVRPSCAARSSHRSTTPSRRVGASPPYSSRTAPPTSRSSSPIGTQRPKIRTLRTY